MADTIKALREARDALLICERHLKPNTTANDKAGTALVAIDAALAAQEQAQAKPLTDADRKDAERYRWLCANLGETQLPALIERITSGYVADYKPSIDAAIDAVIAHSGQPAGKGGAE